MQKNGLSAGFRRMNRGGSEGFFLFFEKMGFRFRQDIV